MDENATTTVRSVTSPISPHYQELAHDYGATQTTIDNLSSRQPQIFTGSLNIYGYLHFFARCLRMHTNVEEVYAIILD